MTPDHEAAKREFRELPTDLGNTVRVPHAATVKFFDWIWDHSAHPEGGPVVMSVDLTPADIANQAAEFFLGASLAPQASVEGRGVLVEALESALDALDAVRDNRSDPPAYERWSKQVERAKTKCRAALASVATPPAAPSDGAMVKGRRAVIARLADDFPIAKLRGGYYVTDGNGGFLQSDGSWGRECEKVFVDRAACLAFLASISGEQTNVKGVK